MPIEPCNTWECVNSFSNWISAFGTLIISGMALWLSVKDRLIDLKATLSVGIIPGNNPSILDQEVFILECVNRGPRPVTITNHYWRLPLHRTKIMFHPNLDPDTGRLCTKLPFELTDGKSAHFFYPIDFFNARLDEPDKIFFPASRVLASFRIRFFSLLVGTSTGTTVRAKIRKGTRKALLAQLRQRTNESSHEA